MAPPLALLLLLTAWCHCCRLSEFACHSGRCVPSGRYCDGNDDCGDLSDEPQDCTNCNRTFYAEANVKTPLRMSSPYKRPLPFVCSMTFVAGDGDLVQLTFLSFQVGALQMNNESRPTCPRGHLRIVEPLPSALLSQQTRGFSQLLSALKQPSEQLSSLFDRSRGSPEFGRFCGEMIGKSATFYGSNVTLLVVVPGQAALHPFSFGLHLTYKYLATPAPRSSAFYGNKLTNTYCDRVLTDCDRKRCVVRSPHFPGFYPRNITCHFWIRQESIPHGRHATIILTQSNEYKISLYTGRSSPLSYPHVALTEECHSDVVRIYDGASTTSPMLLQFCGAGTLPEVISSSSEVLVQLYSSPIQVLHNSYVELDVEVRFTEASELRVREGRCDFAIDGSKHSSGLLYSPRHTRPKNTTCTFRLQGAGPHHRLWIYFLNYFVEDRHPWSRRETCEVGRLEIQEPSGPHKRALLASPLDRPNSYRFCEKTFPRVCARAADHPNFVPVRPCKVPEESYLSRGPSLMIRHSAFTTPDLPAWSSSFMLRYEFVDTRQQGAPAARPCDRRFESGLGTVLSPRNVFFFGRGGSPNISCTYHFLGLPTERVVLTFTDIRLRRGQTCEHHYDAVVQRHTCRGWRAGTAAVRVAERAPGDALSSLACFCGIHTEPRRPIVIESVTNQVRIDFAVSDMSPFDDFNDFGFEAVYEFMPLSLCEANIRRSNGSSEGEVVFRVPSSVEGRAMPLRCRWLLEAAPHKYLYLRFRGTDGRDHCHTGNKIIVYSSLPVAPLSVVCLGRKAVASIAGAESASATSETSALQPEVDVFSNHWYNETSRVLRDHVYVEVLASHAETVRFRWMEVTRRAHCQHRCPELNACIPAELWCDGRPHCPSGYDEAHCDRFPLPYVVAGASAGAALLLLALALVSIRCRRRTDLKEARPVPTEDFPMDTPHGRG